MQVPSKVSAIKIDGKRSYARVRGGEEFEIPARPVTVSSFQVYDVREAEAEDGTPVVDLVVSVVCSSGTYIRALARDLGAGLGVGGHLTALRRTRVGPYALDAARTLDQLQEELTVMPIAEAAAAAFPRWDVDERRAKLLLNGVRLDMPADDPAPVAVFGPDGRFLALVEEPEARRRASPSSADAGRRPCGARHRGAGRCDCPLHDPLPLQGSVRPASARSSASTLAARCPGAHHAPVLPPGRCTARGPRGRGTGGDRRGPPGRLPVRPRPGHGSLRPA